MKNFLLIIFSIAIMIPGLGIGYYYGFFLPNYAQMNIDYGYSISKDQRGPKICKEYFDDYATLGCLKKISERTIVKENESSLQVDPSPPVEPPSDPSPPVEPVNIVEQSSCPSTEGTGMTVWDSVFPHN